MRFLPKLGPEEFEDLFKLFTAAIYQVGISPKEARGLQIQLRERLQKIWDATDPKPFPMVFDDFRQSVIEQFLDRLSKQDPDYRRKNQRMLKMTKVTEVEKVTREATIRRVRTHAVGGLLPP